MNVYRIIMTLALLLLIGCAPQAELEPAAAPEGARETVLQPVPEATSEPVAPVTVDLSKITPVPAEEGELIVQPQPGTPGILPSLIERATDDLRRQLNVSRQAIVVKEATSVNWRDSSLGCPEEDMGYLTVITPGYWIVLEVAGKSYYYHADEAGNQLILCPEERATPPAAGALESSPSLIIQPMPGSPDSLNNLLADVQNDLSGRLNVSRAQIRVLTTQKVEWSDSSLGCPEPDMSYLMVITPGYRIVLEAQGQEHYYHSNESGHFVYCRDSQPPPSPDVEH
jgi:hypothetical protein